MIYFDNAATTFPKPRCVLDKTEFCLKKYCGNAGRSSHSLSLRSGEEIYYTREMLANHIGIDTPEQIVFTYNATYALNLAIKSLITQKCHILISDFEHNSVIRPLEKLKELIGIEYDCFKTDGDIKKALNAALRPDTRVIISSIASNVTGDNIPIKILSDFASENSLMLIIDASQALGHTEINLTETPCDAFCAPGHKGLFGIQGSGFVYFKEKTRRESFIEGGSGSDSASKYMPVLLPEGYEAGTLSTPAIVSLGAGLGYIEKTGIERINEKMNFLTNYAYERLSNINGIRIYKRGCGIISFNLGDIPSSAVAALLDKRGICVRGGLHCAPSIHKKLGTMRQGAVRISFSYLNRKKEVDRFYSALKSISHTLT